MTPFDRERLVEDAPGPQALTLADLDDAEDYASPGPWGCVLQVALTLLTLAGAALVIWAVRGLD